MIVRKWIFAIKLNKNSMSLPQQWRNNEGTVQLYTNVKSVIKCTQKMAHGNNRCDLIAAGTPKSPVYYAGPSDGEH